MEPARAAEIRDFRIRGNYINQRSLLSRRELHSAKREDIAPRRPGYSPPVVEFELFDGTRGSIEISEVDIPLLCEGDAAQAARHLTLILKARRGDAEAAHAVANAAQSFPWRGPQPGQPAESSFVVPSTSAQ